MNNIIKRKWNQNSMVIIEDLQGMAFQAESGGHTFQISGIDGEGNTVALSGTPAGVMLRADGQDVTLTCSVSGGVVSATLPANAYSVPGRFGLTIFLTSDGQKTAIYAAVGTVSKTSSGTVAPPAGSDVVTLVNQINTAIAAIPANYNACFAPAYSTSGLYSVGQYVTYNGNLYRCNTAITTAETWTAAHWTQTNLSADVYDLKSAFSGLEETLETAKTIKAGNAVNKVTIDNGVNVFNKYRLIKGKEIKSDGTLKNNASYDCTEYIPVSEGDVVYSSTNNRYIAFYDSSYNFISPMNSGSSSVTAPTGAAYFRTAMPASSINTNMVFINIATPSTYYPYMDGPNLAIAIDDSITRLYVLEQLQSMTGETNVEKDVLRIASVVNTKSFIDGYVKLITNLGTLTTDYKTFVYPVKNGDACKIKGNGASLGGSYPFAAFFSFLDIAGTTIISGTTTATDYDVSYTVPSDGYIIIAKAPNKNSLSLYCYEKTGSIKNIVDELNDIVGETTHEKGDAVEENNVYSEKYIAQNGTISSISGYTAFKVHEYAVEAGKTYLFYGNAKLQASYPIAGFKASSGTSGTCTILLTNDGSSQLYNYQYTPTANGYVFIAQANDTLLGFYETIAKTEIDLLKERTLSTVGNPWYGKKVVWLGTSVSFGQYATKSYAQEIANYLGFTLVNCSVPGLAIQLNNGSIMQYGSMTASKAEYSAAGVTIPDAPIPYVPGGSYNGYYKTWENIFTEENADADLWVFDCVPNNTNFGLTDWNAFNRGTWSYNDSSSFADHRNTFIGALLFLMDKMYTLNPNARMVFFLGSAFEYANGKTAFEEIIDKYKIGLIDVWGKINTSPKSLLKIKSENGTNAHPSTFAHEIMGKMLVGEFNRFA